MFEEHKFSFTAKRVSFLTGVIFFLALAITIVVNFRIQNNMVYLNNGWTCKVNGEYTQTQPEGELSAFIFPVLKKGDIVELSCPLESFSIDNPELIFYSWHAKVKTFLDDDLLFKRGYDYRENQMVAQFRNEILLPTEYEGKQFTIQLDILEDAAMPSLDGVGVFDAEDQNQFWFGRNVIFICFGLFLLPIAMTMFIIARLVFKDSGFINQIYMTSLTTFGASVYMLCRAHLIEVFFPQPMVYNAIEYYSLFIAPIPILLYGWGLSSDVDKKWIQRVYKIVGASYIALVVIATIANIFEIAPICIFVNAQNVLFLLTMIFILLILENIQDQNDEQPWLMYYSKGIQILVFGCSITVILFQLMFIPKLNNTLAIWAWEYYVLIACMVWSFDRFFHGFAISMKHLLDVNYHAKFLKMIANTDILTGMNNRYALDLTIKRLQENKRKYAIASIDLNDLKKTNDTLGHQVGDELLVAFGNCLRKHETEGIRTFRVGGDEFVVVFDENEDIKDYFRKIDETIQNINKENKKFTISYAKGIAYFEETDDYHKTFALADRRMYQNKRELKQGRDFNQVKVA